MEARPQQTFDTVPIALYDTPDTSIKSTFGEGQGFGLHQFYINMIPKLATNVITGENKVSLEKRQGLVQQMDVLTKSALSGDISGRDLISVNTLSDVLVGAYYRNNGGTKTIDIIQLRPTTNTATVIGTISTTAGPPAVTVDQTTDVFLSEIKIGNVVGIAVTISNTNGSSGYSAGYYALSSSGVFTAASLTKIADADFPTNQTPYVHIVGPMVQMNQVTYVMASDGRVYNSNADSIGTWSALGFLEAESYSDKGVGLVRYKHHLVGCGQSSIEFFDDVGNDPTTGSPLQRTEQAFIKFGVLHAKCMVNIDDVLYWVSTSNSGTVGVWRLDGYTPVKISTSEIDNLISRWNEGTSNTTTNSMTLQQVTINNSKQLVLSGKLVDTATGRRWSNAVANFTYASGEVNLPGDGSDFYIHAVAMDIVSKVWWSIAKGGADYASSDYAHIYYASIGAIGYALVGEPNTASPVSDGKTLFALNPSGSAMVFYDYSTTAAATKAYLSFFSTNNLWFNTNKRKFFHKCRLWKNTIHENTLSEDGIVNLVFMKDSQIELTNSVATIVPKKVQHSRNAGSYEFPFYSIPALGSGYRLQIMVGYFGKTYFAIDGLEMDVSIGVN